MKKQWEGNDALEVGREPDAALPSCLLRLKAGPPFNGTGLLEGGAGAKNESETIGSREFTGSLPAVSLQTVLLIIFPKSAWA